MGALDAIEEIAAKSSASRDSDWFHAIQEVRAEIQEELDEVKADEMAAASRASQ